jgi:hypothetical protein
MITENYDPVARTPVSDDWFRRIGLRFDPYVHLEASGDPHLPEYTVNLDIFRVALDAVPTIIVAPPGGGKTAMRVAVTRTCWFDIGGTYPFPLPYNLGMAPLTEAPMSPLDPALYFDHSATTPPRPEVIEAMRLAMQESWGNPSSLHAWGERAAMAMERARQQVAELLNCEPETLLFTSGGTESNNLALFGVAQRYSTPQHLIISSVEHASVENAARRLQAQGWKVTRLPVNAAGQVDPQTLLRALQPTTVLVSIVHGQNEVGSLQPIAELGRLCRQAGVLFHTDAVQTVGRIPLDLAQLPVDLLSLSGHKLYGPTPHAPSLRVLRVSACIGPAHAEARRRGDRERSAHKTGWTRMHPSPQAGVSRNAVVPDRGQRI